MLNYRFAILAFALVLRAASATDAPNTPPPGPDFPFKKGDHVAWIGSSSTRIGVWCQTMEFLLRSRHPDLQLTFINKGVGGSTFAKGLKSLEEWVTAAKRPTIVFYNFGGNDARLGEKGLDAFKRDMLASAKIAHDAGARVISLTPQPGDERMSGEGPADNRKLYAKAMLETDLGPDAATVDTCTPLDELQQKCEREDSAFTINFDHIHLTDSAYVAWGYFLYERLHPPIAESSAEISADGKVASTTHCKIEKLEKTATGLAFTRTDEILPLLPPSPLPAAKRSAARAPATTATGAAAQPNPVPPTPATNPATPPAPKPPKAPPEQKEFIKKHNLDLPSRKHVPLEKFSLYNVKITGLPAGAYEVLCDGKPIGTTDAAALNAGVNLNSLLLDSGNPAPWLELVTDLYNGKNLESVGTTAFRFEIKRKE